MNADPVNPDIQRGYDRKAYGFTKDDLESLGEGEVRARLINGKYGHINTPPFVSAWLAVKEFERTEDCAASGCRLRRWAGYEHKRRASEFWKNVVVERGFHAIRMGYKEGGG